MRGLAVRAAPPVWEAVEFCLVHTFFYDISVNVSERKKLTL